MSEGFEIGRGMGFADLTGFAVETTDGFIGTVDADTALVAASGDFIVVDADPLVPDKVVLLPATAIEHVDVHNAKVVLGGTRADVGAAPEFDADSFRREPQPLIDAAQQFGGIDADRSS